MSSTTSAPGTTPVAIDHPDAGPAARTVVCASGATLLAVDADDGSVQWRNSLTEYSTLEGPAFADSDAVYTFDNDGYLSIWSLTDGRQRARTRVGTAGLATTAPLVLDGTVFVDNWTGNVVVLDARTLREASWTYRTGSSDAITASPVGSGSTVYFSNPTGYVVAFAADDGARRWAVELSGATELVPVGDLLLTVTDDALVALAVADGDIRWKADLMGCSLPTAIDGAAFVTSGGRLLALDPTDGSIRWQRQAGDSTDKLVGQPAVTGSVVSCLYQKYTYASTDVGIYSGSNSHLAGFDRDSGEPLWQNNSVFPSAAPMGTGGRLYVAADVTSGAPDALCCLDAAGGELIWRRDVVDRIVAPPTVLTDDRVLMAYGGTF